MTDNTEPTPPGIIPGAQPPAPPAPASASAPGLIPGAAAPADATPAPWQQSTTGPLRDARGNPLTAPTSLSWALIGSAGAYTLIGLVVASLAGNDAAVLLDALETGEFASLPVGLLISLLSTPVLILSFIAYGLWAGRMRGNRVAMGDKPGLAGVEWWGWFVPLVGLVLVPMGLRRVSGHKAPVGLLVGWMASWTVAQALSGIAGAVPSFAIDATSGELVRPELVDAYAPLMWASAPVLVLALVLFVLLIRRSTTAHLEP
ncbi:hypothetical protein QQX13_04815 [Demequina sp. SYSU T00068]|uniref:hypothetical protein n=1 Tax=Demequina lignilytica TaxID=3051663 RepID=UPI00260D93CD|nr:hypothetical protein [Demequina sp. SYSU T00068]MDN4490146.1 hypothetical protein [Demequina sp. SYSU T00068]